MATGTKTTRERLMEKTARERLTELSNVLYRLRGDAYDEKPIAAHLASIIALSTDWLEQEREYGDGVGSDFQD